MVLRPIVCQYVCHKTRNRWKYSLPCLRLRIAVVYMSTAAIWFANTDWCGRRSCLKLEKVDRRKSPESADGQGKRGGGGARRGTYLKLSNRSIVSIADYAYTHNRRQLIMVLALALKAELNGYKSPNHIALISSLPTTPSHPLPP